MSWRKRERVKNILRYNACKRQWTPVEENECTKGVLETAIQSFVEEVKGGVDTAQALGPGS